MPTTQRPKQRADTEQHEREMLNALIGEQLLHTLGEPGDLLKVQVRPLWEDRYRVNVLTGGDAEYLASVMDLGVQLWPEMTLEGIRISAEALP